MSDEIKIEKDPHKIEIEDFCNWIASHCDTLDTCAKESGWEYPFIGGKIKSGAFRNMVSDIRKNKDSHRAGKPSNEQMAQQFRSVPLYKEMILKYELQDKHMHVSDTILSYMKQIMCAIGFINYVPEPEVIKAELPTRIEDMEKNPLDGSIRYPEKELKKWEDFKRKNPEQDINYVNGMIKFLKKQIKG
jgi:hypothetical protein